MHLSEIIYTVGKYFITPRHIKYQLGLEDLQPMPVIRTLGRINKRLGRIEDGLLTLMVESRYIHGLKICRTELQNFIVRFCSGDAVQTPIKERRGEISAEFTSHSFISKQHGVRLRIS